MVLEAGNRSFCASKVLSCFLTKQFGVESMDSKANLLASALGSAAN
jgi:hypothetical protein